MSLISNNTSFRRSAIKHAGGDGKLESSLEWPKAMIHLLRTPSSSVPVVSNLSSCRNRLAASPKGQNLA